MQLIVILSYKIRKIKKIYLPWFKTIVAISYAKYALKSTTSLREIIIYFQSTINAYFFLSYEW